MLQFIYVDEFGEVTERMITDWVEDEIYIEGWCADRHARRIFRKDRVDQWLNGSDVLLE